MLEYSHELRRNTTEAMSKSQRLRRCIHYYNPEYSWQKSSNFTRY